MHTLRSYSYSVKRYSYSIAFFEYEYEYEYHRKRLSTSTKVLQIKLHFSGSFQAAARLIVRDRDSSSHLPTARPRLLGRIMETSADRASRQTSRGNYRFSGTQPDPNQSSGHSGPRRRSKKKWQPCAAFAHNESRARISD